MAVFHWLVCYFYAFTAKDCPSGCPAIRPSGHVFLYYANMVQQIEFIIYTNIQPLRQSFLPKVEGQG